MALSVFQPVSVIMSLISWVLIPTFACDASLPAYSTLPLGTAPSDASCRTKHANHGWRYALFPITGSGSSVFAFVGRFWLFTFLESQKCLVGGGWDKEAVKAVRAIAVINKVSSSIKFDRRSRGGGWKI